MNARRHACVLAFAVAVAGLCAPASAQHPDDIYWTVPWVGANQQVRSLYATSDDLYFGGHFTVINGLNIAGLARWDGANWEAVGDQSRAAYVIFPYGTTLYACTTPIGVTNGPRFSIWQDDAWQHFEVTNIGINNQTAIADIVEFKGDIYVGGSFRNIGRLQTYGIARWDGTEFHDLQHGLSYLTGWYSEYDDGKVYGLVATDSLLYVGGEFTHAGGVKASNLAAWDGARWLPFPDYSVGSSGRIAAANGRLYSSGYSSTVSDGVGYGIFMWDGQRWYSMNGGLNRYLLDLATDGTNLYVVGPFTRAGGFVANNVARWDGEAWSALGGGIIGVNGTIAVRSTGEVFLGGQTAGAASHHVARFYNPCPYPGHPSPAHASTKIPRWTALSWDDVAAPGPATSWDLQFGTSTPPPTVATGLTSRAWQPDTLAYKTTYYWRVIAHDAAGNHATGQVWKFTTEPLITARLSVSPAFAHCRETGPDTVVVDVSIEKAPGVVDAAGFDLPFDPGLAFVGCEAGELTAGWDHFGGADRGGMVRVGGYDLDGIPAGTSGVLARLRFAVDCCAFDTTASFALCPVNLVDDLKALTPFCAALTCTSYVHDGDVDGDGRVTAADAVCAVESFVGQDSAEGCASAGWDIRGDVDCSGQVTPRDAACIHRNWSDASCTFCTGTVTGVRAAPVAALPPVITVANTVVEGDLLSIVVAVEGVASLEAFGFDITYPEARVAFAGVTRAPAIEWFESVARGQVDSGHARVGGFGSVAASAPVQTDLLVIGLRIRDYLAGTVTLTGFVDDLAGASDVALDLEAVTGVTPAVRALSLEQNRPNPFNPLTTIRYEIPRGFQGGRVRLSIYDVAGRRVRTLVDRPAMEGAHDAPWDGRDDRGARVTSGVYFYVLDANGTRLARKLVLLK